MGIQPRPISTIPPSAMLRFMHTQPTNLSPAISLVLADGKGPQRRIKLASYQGGSALFRLQYPTTIFISLRTPGDYTSLIFHSAAFVFQQKLYQKRSTQPHCEPGNMAKTGTGTSLMTHPKQSHLDNCLNTHIKQNGCTRFRTEVLPAATTTAEPPTTPSSVSSDTKTQTDRTAEPQDTTTQRSEFCGIW